MAFEQYTKRDWTSVAAAATELENSKGCFDCNICLDLAHEPVVTLCGHLYCWPCIYQWIHTQSAPLASDEHPQCPVCKAGISHTTMVPLYGRGNAQTGQVLKGNAPQLGLVIPARPSAFGTQEALAVASTNSITGQQLQYRNPYQSQQYNIPDPYGSHEEEYSPSLFNLGGNGAAGFSHPVAGMFGEMVYARVFGNSNRLGAYPNSYHAVGSSSLRLRRLEMQADKSLNRISIFLLCCFVLCLLLF